MSFSGKVINRKDNSPLSGIPVTDGRNVVFTDDDGQFLLPGWERAKIISLSLLTQRHNDWYMPIEGHVGDFNFMVDLVNNVGEDFCFLQTSDTEIENRPMNEWISYAKDCVDAHSPAFFMHTGDLCREDGVKRHYLAMNRETVGCPVRYCIGNHDFIGEKYGEEIYEKLYGPTWYSFDCGNYHFACLSIAYGDNPSGYSHDDQWIWLSNDLETAGKGKKLVICCHDICASDPTGFTKQFGEITLNLREKGLCAWVYGHYHVNMAHDYDGIYSVTVSRPDSGGIDSSPAAFRKIDCHSDKITTELLFNSPECDEPDKSLWQTEIGANVEFSAPVLYENSLYVATSDDSLPKKCGVTKLCTDDGKILWFYETKGDVKGDVVISEKKLYVQDSYGILYCLDTDMGKLLWTAKSTMPRCDFSRMSITLADKFVIAGHQEHLHAYDKDSGKLVWNTPMSHAEGCPAKIVYDKKRKRLIVSRHWKSLSCIDLENGQLLWENFDRPYCWHKSSTAYLDDDGIYLGGLYTLAKICPETGKSLFTKPAKARMDVSGAPECDGKNLYFPTGDKGVMAVDKETLEFVGFFPASKSHLFTAPYLYGNICSVESTPVLFKDMLIFTAADGYIYFYNKNTFELVKKISTGQPVIARAIIAKDKVIACTFFGKICAFDL